MSWPPTTGERLPNGDNAAGAPEKLIADCLNLDDELGGPKALGFLRILGITIADVDHLADASCAGAREAPVSAVRQNTPYGVLCEVRVPVRGSSAPSGIASSRSQRRA